MVRAVRRGPPRHGPGHLLAPGRRRPATSERDEDIHTTGLWGAETMTTEASAQRRGRTETRASNMCERGCGRTTVPSRRWCPVCRGAVPRSSLLDRPPRWAIAETAKTLREEFEGVEGFNGIEYRWAEGAFVAKLHVDALRRLLGGRG